MQSKEKVQPRKIHKRDLEITDQDNESTRRRKQVIINEFGRRSVGGLLTPADQQLIRHRSYSRIRQQGHDKGTDA